MHFLIWLGTHAPWWWGKLRVFGTLFALALVAGCFNDSSGPDAFVEPQLSDPPSQGEGGGGSGLIPLCQAWMIHAKVVGQDPNAVRPDTGEIGYVDIALELKDQRVTFPAEQGGIALDDVSIWLVVPSQYLTYYREFCLGPPLTTDGQGEQCTGWIINNSSVEYDDLPFPRIRIHLSQSHGGGGVPMPPGGKRLIGTARLWRTGAEGMQKTHSYRGNVATRFETMAQACGFAARSAWGHELTFGPVGTPVAVGPEAHFCGIYPGCAAELEYCDDCPQ